MPKSKKKSKSKKKFHVKPTQKELDESLKKTEKELEALKDKPTPSKPIPSPEPMPEPTPEPEPTPSEPAPSPDYKEKFIASSREAQVLHAKNKKVNEVLSKAQEISDPTDEEMIAEYPDWEVMSDFEKKMAKDTLIAKRRFDALAEIAKESKNAEEWHDKVDKFLDDPKSLTDHPDLEGKEDEFRLFATKPTRRGVDFEDLIAAFLYTAKPAKPEKKKAKMFPTGTGGPGKPSKEEGKLSIEEARELRNTDYKKYKKLLLAGKISEKV